MELTAHTLSSDDKQIARPRAWLTCQRCRVCPAAAAACPRRAGWTGAGDVTVGQSGAASRAPRYPATKTRTDKPFSYISGYCYPGFQRFLAIGDSWGQNSSSQPPVSAALTLSLPRVINFHFPLKPHQKYKITRVWRTWLFVSSVSLRQSDEGLTLKMSAFPFPDQRLVDSPAFH